MGLGLALALAALWLLGQLSAETPWRELLGKVVIEGVPVAIGVSVGTAQLGGGNGGEDEDRGLAENGSRRRETSWWGELVLAAGGAVLLAANVAPTEEVLLIAVGSAAWKTLLLVLLSLALAAVILYYSDFTGAESAAAAGGVARGATGVLAVYAVALLCSAFILWFFGHFAGAAPALCVAQTAVLAVPASLGAAGGRLLLR